MKSLGYLLGIVSVLISSVGCSTFFHASAPAAAPNTRYAVGTKQGFFSNHAAVWLCKDGKAAECEEVEVIEK